MYNVYVYEEYFCKQTVVFAVCAQLQPTILRYVTVEDKSYILTGSS